MVDPPAPSAPPTPPPAPPSPPEPPLIPLDAVRPRRRRGCVWLAVLAVLLLVVAGTAVAVGGVLVARNWAPVSTIGAQDFGNPLRIPPLAEPTVDADGTKRFALRLQAGTTSFLPGAETATWGYDGSYLAPTLRAARGDRVAVDVTNGVDEATTLHWHGMHLPAAADGGPHQLIEPGATWSPSWTIDQPASTLWFHPHLHGATGDQVQRGAAGLFIVDDPEADPGDLPSRYGIDDIPLIVQDRSFDGDGQFASREPMFGQMGPLGDRILVNGTMGPHLDVTTERVRLRLLNASNARIYNFGFDDRRSFELIATDGGLLEHPASLASFQLSPGERAEVVVAIAPGDRAVLRSDDVHITRAGDDPGLFVGGADSFDVLELRAADELDASPAIPSDLASIDRPRAEDAVTTRHFDLDNNKINGQHLDMDRVDVVATLDTTEVWEITNEHGLPHSFHPHLVHAVVLDIDGEAPPPELSGWKDTVFVPPGSTVRLALRFEDHADPTTPYMFHCHILRHEDNGMMGQFVVVEPGDAAAVAPATSDAHAGHQDR